MNKIIQQDKNNIKRMMNDIENGLYNIPIFQRNFVWKYSKVIELMNSIQSNFPIGVFLLASSNESKLKDGRNRIVDYISNYNYRNNGFIVVDGQQRLSSIIIVYFAPKLRDAIDSKKIIGDSRNTILKTLKNLAFYNGRFISVQELVSKLNEEDGISELAAKAKAYNFLIDIPEINNQVKEMLNNKDIFTQTLKGRDDKEIIEIFSAMNRKTLPLNHIDLMNGQMYNSSDEKFDLLSKIESSNKIWKNFGKIKKELFVILVKIYNDLKLNFRHELKVNYKPDALIAWASKKDVNTFVERYNLFEDTVKDSLSILDKKLDIYCIQNIPKEIYLIIIFTIICMKDKDTKERDGIIKKAISDTTINLIYGDFASSPNAKIMNYINNYLIKIINREQISENINEEDKMKSRKDNLIDTLLAIIKATSYKNKNTAIFKLFRSAISAQKPMNLFSDGYVQVRPTEVTEHKTDIHHFVPIKSNSSEKFHFGERLHDIGNLTLLEPNENQNKIRNKETSVYLMESKKILGEKRFEECMKSHLFDLDLINEILNIDFQNEVDSVSVHAKISKLFSERRKLIVQKIIEKFIQY